MSEGLRYVRGGSLPFALLPQALIYIRGSAPTGFGMLPPNDGSI